jgi:hypothetical protein
MRSSFLFLAVLTTLFAIPLSVSAQTPSAWYPFDGNVNDKTANTGRTISGGSPVYAQDRFGNANNAWDLNGNDDFIELLTTTTNNSALDLGMKGNFTAMVWLRADAPDSGDNMVFGSAGSGTGTPHYGLRSNAGGKVHMGMWGNDLQAGYGILPNQWYHLTYQFDGSSQRIFLNGLQIAIRATSNTTKDTNIRIGNSVSNSNSFEGRLADAVIFDSALTNAQILDIVNTTDPTRPELPADPFPGNLGAAGLWGVRDIRNHTLQPASIQDAMVIAYNQSGGTVTNGTRSAFNLSDPDTSNNAGNFGGDQAFVSNTAGADDNIIVIGQAFVQIDTDNDYTFGFSGDDGSRLRIYGQDFISAVTTAGGNGQDPPNIGDQIFFTEPTGNGTVLGIVHLTPGVYFVEHLFFEATGGAWSEVYAAPGAKTSFDSSFKLIGGTGGLSVVAPRPIIKYFEANATVVTGGNPSTITFSWDTLFDTSLSISSVGAVTGKSRTISSPATTTTYTFSATRGGITVTEDVTIFVDPPPTVLSFSANDTQVATGDPVVLSWNTVGGTGYVINPGNINVTGNTTNGVGSVTVNPTVTTNYTLAVTGNGSATSNPLTVTVGPPPVISSFTVNDSSPAPGAVSTLEWTVGNYTFLSLDNDIGDVTSLVKVFVCANGTTTYTLTAANDFGSSTAQVTITAAAPIGVAASGYTIRFVSSSTTINSLATADALLAGANIVNDTTLTNVSQVNYTDAGTSGELSGDASFPPGFTDNFVMQATGTIVVNVSGNYTFGINNDDGGRLRIDGSDKIVDDALHGATTSETSVFLNAGSHTVEYIFFEAGGGAAGEFFHRPVGGIAESLSVTAGAGSITTSNIIINEIMADNVADVLVDSDGDASDWIELFNGTGAAINISGWHLSDDAALLTKWAFPAGTTIPAGGYLIVFASDKNIVTVGGEIHTNFKLTSAGEYLALVAANGTTIIDEFSPTYPPQSNGVSWGTYDTEQYEGYFVSPTPGGLNTFGYDGLVADTGFSVDRGFYTAAFPLTITSATPGATILYTTDGSEPSIKNATNGITYTGPITIDETVVIRARAVKEGFFSSNVDTQTYIFVDDVVNQNAAHAHALGFPDTSVNGQTFEYDMNLGAVSSAQVVKDALKAIPTISLVLNQKDFSDPTEGIYVNAGSRGLERKASIELINENGLLGGQLQEDCGLRVRGGFSRSNNNPKHAFRIFFRKAYGAGKLKYSLFQDEGTNEFDGFDLRTSQNYSWAFQNDSKNTFLREVFGRDTQAAMGQPYTRSRYYHLYINGHYWGLYMSQERAEADYAASYFGGVDTDYDTIKSAGSSGGYNTETTDGDFLDWTKLWDWDDNDANGTGTPADPSNANYFDAQGLAADGVTPNSSPVLLDVDNLADYMLVVFYTGSFDAPLSTFLNNASNNWFSVRNRETDDQGVQFFFHDGEHSMGTDNDTRSTDRTGPWGPIYNTIDNFSKSNPQYIHEDLAQNAEYRLAFADRAHRALVAPGGALDQSQVEARINARAAVVQSAIDAEAARWGSPSLNKNTWLNAKAALLDWIDRGSNQQPANGPGRAEVVLTQLRNYADGALYPSLDAPIYTQNGNSTPIGSSNVPANYQVAMVNPDNLGTIYYTTDGSDPRVVGGAVKVGASTYSSAVTLNATTTIKSRVRNGSTWSALNEATFLVGSLADASNLVVSKIYYNPPGSVETDEYIEIMNISGNEIELANLSFASGLTFDFNTAADTTLSAGERAVIVVNRAAFETTFAAQLPIHILGEFVGALSNSGERIALLDASGGTIKDFSYNDAAPWPVSADGDGPALVLINPESNPDHSIGTNWRASSTAAGTPGSDDRTLYATWKSTNGVGSDTEDTDDDGLSALLEFAFGGSTTTPNPELLPQASVQTLTVNSVTADYLTITIHRGIGAEEVTYTPEISTDLAQWNNGPLFVVQEGSPQFNGDGTETVIYRSTDPVTTDERLFIRVKVSL